MAGVFAFAVFADAGSRKCKISPRSVVVSEEGDGLHYPVELGRVGGAGREGRRCAFEDAGGTDVGVLV